MTSPSSHSTAGSRTATGHRVYISHVSDDNQVAREICEGLEARGVKCWIAPRDIQVGTDYAEAITAAIEECAAMLLVVSSHTNASRFVLREVERAVSKGRVLLPVFVEDVRPTGSLEYHIAGYHSVFAHQRPLSLHIDSIAASLHAFLPGSGSVASARPAKTRILTQGAKLPTQVLLGGMAAVILLLVLWFVWELWIALPNAWLRLTESLSQVEPWRGWVAMAAVLTLGLAAGAVARRRTRRPTSIEKSGTLWSPSFLSNLRAMTLSQLVEVGQRLEIREHASGTAEPGEMDVLNSIDRLCRHVDQATVLQDPFLKKGAMEAALQESAALQSRLIDLQDRVPQELRDTIRDWRGLLEAERARVAQQAEAARPIPNPFVVGNPIKDQEQNVFMGRRDVTRQIEENILGAAHAPTLVLYGERRMGKSSILYQLPRLLGPNLLPVLMDMQNPAAGEGPASLLRYMSKVIANAVNQRLAHTEVSKAARSVSSGPLLRALTVDQLGNDRFAVFDDWMDSVEASLPDGLRILVCLDEYERLRAALQEGWGENLLDAFRHWMQHRHRLIWIFTGARTFEELGPAWTDRFIAAKRIKVSYLSNDDVNALLTRPTDDFGVVYQDGVLDELFRQTHGQPFLTQAVASELVSVLNGSRRRCASLADVETAVERTLSSAGEYFANVWTSLSKPCKTVVQQVAQGRSTNDDSMDVAWLREHDVLSPTGELVVPMLQRWVARQAGSRVSDEVFAPGLRREI